MIATVTAKGQVTLPKLIRQRLNIQNGDRIDFILDEHAARAILQPINKKVDDVFGMLSKNKNIKSLTIEEMNEGIAKAVKKRSV